MIDVMLTRINSSKIKLSVIELVLNDHVSASSVM